MNKNTNNADKLSRNDADQNESDLQSWFVYTSLVYGVDGCACDLRLYG